MNRTLTLFLLCLLMTGLPLQAQQRKFSVANFAHDPFDLTAKNDQYKKVDGNGSLYAIIKVTSTSPDDQLRDYRFNFGNMNHEVVARDGELWVYVQRNAKMVTISRQGFATINKYDLKTTVEAGNTYTMQLSPTAAKVLTQMVMFSVNPAGAKAMVMLKHPNGGEDVLGITDESGNVAASIPFGSYTYRVAAGGFYTSEGSFRLDDAFNTHVEKVELKAKFGNITLRVNADADIYVNGELKGHRNWSGQLNSGQYQIECRQANHYPTSRSITVEEGINESFDLDIPIPITGTLSLMSNPLGAAVTLDGQPQGTTPKNIPEILVGRHSVVVSKDGYDSYSQSFDITEGQTTTLNLTLKKSVGAGTVAQPTGQFPMAADVNHQQTNQTEERVPPTALKKKNDYKRVKWNIKVGGSLAFCAGTNGDVSTKSKMGGKIGVGLEKPLSPNFSLMPSLELAMKGAKWSFSFLALYESYEETLSPLYIQIPILGAYRMSLNNDWNMTIKAGPYFAYGLSGDYEYKCDYRDYEDDYYGNYVTTEKETQSGSYDLFSDLDAKRFDAGVDIGIDFEYHRFVVGMEYERGFISFAPEYSYTDVYNQALYLTVGYKF